MDDFKGKRMVMEIKSKLKHIIEHRIFIDHLTLKEREIQRRIREEVQREKKNRKKVRTSYKRLQIDGTWWRWNEDEDKLESDERGKLQQGTKN